MGNRVAEILAHIHTSQWYHVKSCDNIVDLGTRDGTTIDDIKGDSIWQLGLEWLRLEWPSFTGHQQKN